MFFSSFGTCYEPRRASEADCGAGEEPRPGEGYAGHGGGEAYAGQARPPGSPGQIMSRPGRAWPIILTGLVVWTLSVGMYRTFGVFFKPMAEELGWSRTLTSGGFAVMGLVMGLMGPLAGALADRRGPRLVVAGSGLFMGLGYALLSRLHSVGQFYGFFFLVGLGMGSAFAPVSAAVSRWFTQGMGLALGVVSIGGGLGMMTVVPLAERLIAWWGWRPAYLVMGVLMGVGVMVAGFLMPQRKERVVIAGGEDPPAAA